MDLEILKIASNTENHKIIKNHTHSSKNKNPICGDENANKPNSKKR